MWPGTQTQFVHTYHSKLPILKAKRNNKGVVMTTDA